MERFLDWIKLSPRQLLAIALASGFLALAPDRFLEPLGLLTFRNTYRAWLGVPLLAAAALLGAYALTAAGSFVQQRFTWRRTLKRHQQALHGLSPAEQAVLRGYIFENTKTQYFALDNGVVQGLVSAGVLYRSANVGDVLTGFPFNIQPWAWQYLHFNRHLLIELPIDPPPDAPR
jgi:hypothetical protein